MPNPPDKHIIAAAEAAGYGGTVIAIKSGAKYTDNTCERSILAHASTMHKAEQEIAALRAIVGAYFEWGSRNGPAAFQERFPQFAEHGVEAIDEAARQALTKATSDA